MRNVLERVINLLAFLLTTRQPVTAEVIRRTVAGYGDQTDEAFRRMFERDKELLRRLGIPVVAKADAWGIEHGYRVRPDEYRLPDPGLTDDERAALWLAAQVVRVGGQPSGAEALLKLGGTRTAPASDPLAADLGPEIDTLADLYAAVGEHRMVRFDYRGRRRVVEPHGVAHRRGHWYLVGVEAGEDRTYRIDRISGLVVTGEPGSFKRSDARSIAERIEIEPWEAGTDEPIEAKVRFDPEAAWWAERRVGPTVQTEQLANGAIEASFRVSHPDAFIGWVLTFGEHAEVLSPPQIRARLLARVRGEA